ncbi:hypothetical protein [Longitalea luteola]|uniref:hypothetical protein n=1 Tax=Longitalea luteola TaxID=2812563 RepID=UPI001A9659B7|nr:hypothetical protein [Longitalea luteola]
MAKNTNIELPLYNAFIQLMQLEKDQPNKGIDPGSYLQLIDVLHQGYALNSKDELLFFCKKLWLKPFHTGNAAINEQVMENIINDNLHAYETVTKKKRNKATDASLKSDGDLDPLNNRGDIEPKKSAEDKPNEDGPEKKGSPEKQIPTPAATTTSLVINIEESREGKALDQQDYSTYFNDKKFKFDYTYLTVSPRFIEQTIRSLRYKVKGTGKPVIDMEATVKDVGAKGYFDNWQFSEEEDFVTRWTLLFDRGGSMIAFHGLQDTMTEAVMKGSIKNDGDIFYFRNIARDFLFTTPQRTLAVPFDEVANGARRNILIVSDGGAARGSFDEDRIQHTYLMIHQLRKHRIAWLNPLPKERWKNSSASVIAGFVNMFQPGNDYSDDLGNIVRLFKSKLITPITR